MSFIDNTAAQFALTKAYSSDDAVNILSSIFWAATAEWGAAPWFERVSSAANIVSRGDFSAAYSRGAQQVSVNFDKVWLLLSQAVRHNEFAHAEVGNQIRTLVRRNGQGL